MHARLRRYGNLQAYGDKTFESFRTHALGGSYTQNVKTSLETAKQAGLDFAAHPKGFIVYEGKYGCGKTHLAVAIANHRLERFGDPLIFVTVPDLLDLLRISTDQSLDTSYYDFFNQIRGVSLLVLDDLGVEKRTEWANEKMFQLLNHRLVESLPTVITTNTPIDDLDPRISSRLMDGDKVRRFIITAPDYRRAQRSRVDAGGLFGMHLYKDMQFTNFRTESPYREESQNLRNAKSVASKWAANPDGWLYIRGTFGSGKTHLAAAIAYDIHERGGDVRFLSVPDLLDQLRLAFDPSVNARFDKQFHEIVNAPALILDDVRFASATPWAKEKLFQIIDYRYLARSPTVITSSETMKEMDPRLETRLMDDRVCLAFELTVGSYVKRIKTNS